MKETLFDSNLFNYSLINILRTGHILFDTLLTLLMPIIIAGICTIYKNHYQSVSNYIYNFISKEYQRELVYTDENQDSIDNSRNNILQKALIMYISDIYKFNSMKANIELKAIKENLSRGYHFGEITYGSTTEQLKAYKIYITPPEKYWIKITDKINVYIQYDYITLENTRIKKTKIFLKCRDIDGSKILDNFINDAFKWYINKMSSIEDINRYMYMPIIGYRRERSIKYKRYLLNDNKTFDSLFFEKKDI